MRYHCFLLALAFLAGAPALYAQVDFYTIRGTVTEVGTSEPLPGVNVRIRGTTFGTATSPDGNYTFQAPVSPGTYTLEFTFVGYRQALRELTLGSDRTVTVNAQIESDILNLDDVVVTGNSPTATRRQLGTNISVVNGADMAATPTPNPLAALSGRVMGAQVRQNSGDPAGGISVRLRGASSVTGSSDPLYIVDGVIVDNSSQNVINLSGDAMGTSFAAGQNRLVDLNAEDIERIEVLNGAAAAAIYGSRASNGVVQIFTKRGQVGRPQISYSASVTQSALRHDTYLTTHGKRFGVQGSSRLATAQDRLTILLTLGLSEAALQQQGIGFVKVGPGAGRVLVTDTYDVQRYNYWDEIFDTAYGFEQNLSVSGGTDRTRYFASAGALRNGGIVRNTSFEKYNGRVKLDQTLASWADVSLGLAYTYSQSQDMPNGNNFFSPVSTVYIMDNVWDITERDANGNLLHGEPVRLNPLSVIETFDLSQTTNRATGNVNLNLYPVKGLTVAGIIGLDTYALEGQEFHPRVPYSGVAATFFPDGYASVAKDNVLLVNAGVTASYLRALGADIQTTTTTGYDLQYNRNNFTYAEGRDLSPFIQTIRGVTNFFNRPDEYIAERMIVGGFLQETVGWRDQVFVTVAGRIDGSSSFSEGNQQQFYPKASVSWVASELWKNNAGLNRALSTFKLRASYGQAGNLTGIGPYDRYDNYLISTIGGLSAFNPSRSFANPDVKPERMTEIEGGFDAALLQGRLGLSLNLYQQRVRDVLLFLPVPPSVGGESIVTNLSDEGTYIQNTGVEVRLDANVLRRRGLDWNVGFLYNRNANIVRGTEGAIALRGGDGPQYLLDGQPFGVFYGRYYARDEAGNLLLTAQGLRQPERGSPAGCALADQNPCAQRDAAGQPVGTELRRVIGSPDPLWTGAFTTDVTYKRFRLNLLLDASYGAEIYNWNRITGNNVGHGELAEMELRGEVPRGTVASVAGGVTGQRIQEEHVEDGSFLKVREVGLTYSAGRVGPWFSGATISLAARNLYSFDSYSGFDPETNSAGQSDRVRGDDFGNVPIPRTVQLRLNLRF